MFLFRKLLSANKEQQQQLRIIGGDAVFTPDEVFNSDSNLLLGSVWNSLEGLYDGTTGTPITLHFGTSSQPATVEDSFTPPVTECDCAEVCAEYGDYEQGFNAGSFYYPVLGNSRPSNCSYVALHAEADAFFKTFDAQWEAWPPLGDPIYTSGSYVQIMINSPAVTPPTTSHGVFNWAVTSCAVGYAPGCCGDDPANYQTCNIIEEQCTEYQWDTPTCYREEKRGGLKAGWDYYDPETGDYWYRQAVNCAPDLAYNPSNYWYSKINSSDLQSYLSTQDYSIYGWVNETPSGDVSLKLPPVIGHTAEHTRSLLWANPNAVTDLYWRNPATGDTRSWHIFDDGWDGGSVGLTSGLLRVGKYGVLNGVQGSTTYTGVYIYQKLCGQSVDNSPSDYSVFCAENPVSEVIICDQYPEKCANSETDPTAEDCSPLELLQAGDCCAPDCDNRDWDTPDCWQEGVNCAPDASFNYGVQYKRYYAPPDIYFGTPQLAANASVEYFCSLNPSRTDCSAIVNNISGDAYQFKMFWLDNGAPNESPWYSLTARYCTADPEAEDCPTVAPTICDSYPQCCKPDGQGGEICTQPKSYKWADDGVAEYHYNMNTGEVTGSKLDPLISSEVIPCGADADLVSTLGGFDVVDGLGNEISVYEGTNNTNVITYNSAETGGVAYVVRDKETGVIVAAGSGSSQAQYIDYSNPNNFGG